MRGKGVFAALTFAAMVGCNSYFTPDSGSSDAGGDAEPPLPKLPIDKVDLLLMVDNSLSMGDKQELLAMTVPDIVSGLLALQGANGTVSDIHVGVVTSSLGGGGAVDVCDPNARIQANEAPNLVKFNRHNDDQGHLINRQKPVYTNPPPSGVEDPVPDVSGSNVLAWQADKATFDADFQLLVRGTQEFGCGLEAQLESWYRFLVQPDPYDSIALDTGQSPAAASLEGVDATILQQRADFLRADSLLVVLVLTDEDDSWSDPMWHGGRGWITRAFNNTFSTTGQLPRGTAACSAPVDPNNPLNTGPNDPACRWCGSPGTSTDPNCATNNGLYGPKEDGLNVRYTNDMKRRYGMNPQFPVARYVDGLTSSMVPDRTGEHYTADNNLSETYLGRKNCRNPIYSAVLPTDPDGEKCNLPRNGRTSDQVLFAVIGGVPWQIAGNGQPTDEEWTQMLGKDPTTYQADGIDPHMIESIKPRAGLSCGGGAAPSCDPINGKEWDTSTSKVGIDLQYACIFNLPTPKDCTKLPEGASCDCGGSYAGPLCDPNPGDGNNLTLQSRGKAYPSIRELRVARGVGGVVGSICPRTLDPNSPDYGFRPTVRALMSRATATLAAHNP